MKGSIHDCIIDIKGGRCSKVLLREANQYKTVKASSSEGIKALDPLLCDLENLVGVFTPSVPTAVIYEEAGETMPHAQGVAA